MAAISALKYVALLPRSPGFERGVTACCRFLSWADDSKNHDSSHVNYTAWQLLKKTMANSGAFLLIFTKPHLSRRTTDGMYRFAAAKTEYCGKGVTLA
jgi:hypothetical protein